MKTNMNKLIIDWDLGTKLAGNKPELAKEILNLLIKNLPAELEQIKRTKDLDNLPLLLKHVHKLLGAVSYCGAPRLKNALINYENALKNGDKKTLDAYFADLEFEINQLIEHSA
jgi:two-component system, NarL family, sensor histidine kinase BarA